MESQLSTKNILVILSSVGVSTLLVFVIGFLLFFNFSSRSSAHALTDINGIQYIELKAKNGFTPSLSTISANKEAELRVNTDGTFDCSSTISIPKLGINQALPATGTTVFKIPAQMAGTTLDGTCSMGMYRFQIVTE